MVIIELEPGLPAHTCGLLVGDVVLSVDEVYVVGLGLGLGLGLVLSVDEVYGVWLGLGLGLGLGLVLSVDEVYVVNPNP